MVDSFDPVGFGERLRAAMAERGLDKKSLQQRVRARVHERMGGQVKGMGTSYGAIWCFVSGSAPAAPRREVLDAIAEEVDRLPHFLVTGEPPRDRRELAERQAPITGADESNNQESRRFKRDIEMMVLIAKETGQTLVHPDVAFVFRTAVHELLEAGSRSLADYSEEEVREVVNALAFFWTLPVTILRSRESLIADPQRWRAFSLAAAQAWELALPPRGSASLDPSDVFLQLRALQPSADERGRTKQPKTQTRRKLEQRKER